MTEFKERKSARLSDKINFIFCSKKNDRITENIKNAIYKE